MSNIRPNLAADDTDLRIGEQNIASLFGITPRTLKRWLKADPEFPIAWLPNGEPVTSPAIIHKHLAERAGKGRP